jgi:hypothetical protein
MLRNAAAEDHYDVPILDDQGWFAAQLPAGTYRVTMGYYIWLFGTPARIEVPAEAERCYAGTLAINLFARSSFATGWVRGSGGILPMDDIDFALLDQSNDAAAYAGTSLPLCAMSFAPRESTD